MLGAITGIPIGVVNLAIVDAAARGEDRFARGIAVGGALADGVHAAIAFIGVARVLEAHPAWMQAMAITAAIAIAIYVALDVRPRRHAARRAGGGIVTGLVLTLPNPAALGAWVAVAAALWPTIEVVATISLAIGVAVGSGVWFTLLARWIAKLPRDGRAARVLPKVALSLLAAIAVLGIIRAFA